MTSHSTVDIKAGRIRKPLAVGTGVTHLDSTVAGLVWGDGFTYGSGLNAVTGSLAGKAVKPFTVVPPISQETYESVSMVSDESDYNLQVGVSAAGKYNIEGVTVSASTDFLTNVKYSSTMITLLVRSQVLNSQYSEAKNYVLTEEAQKLIIADVTKFRQIYGDYFISGSLNGSNFVANFVCKAQSDEQMNSFKASLGASIPELYTVQGSTEFTQYVKENNIQLEVQVWAQGVNGAPPNVTNTQELLAALAWFKANLAPAPFKVKMMHYSVLDFNFPTTLPIDETVFSDLSILYQKVWDVRSRYASIPGLYQDRYRDKYDDVNTGIPAAQEILVTDADFRQECDVKVSSLLEILTTVLARQQFWQYVLAAASTEPRQGQQNQSSPNIYSQLYGYKTWYDPQVSINTWQSTLKKDWTVGHVSGTILFQPGPQDLVVGWEVINNKNSDTNGYWVKTQYTILGTTSATTSYMSDYDRGIDWTLKVYWVPSNDYQFSQTKSKEKKSSGSLESKLKSGKKSLTTTVKKLTIPGPTGPTRFSSELPQQSLGFQSPAKPQERVVISKL